MILYRTVDSPIGPLTLAGRGPILTQLRMVNQTAGPNRAQWVSDDRAFPDVVEQLEAYFAGQRTTFDIQLELRGSQFQRQVWEALLTIPYGETSGESPILSPPGSRVGFCCSGFS
ncbi:hypothetical protein MHEC_15330 [Mycobacterium heckeshornense]|uniref:Methylguanine DNA methyltransferase ribonuclease-like domain-containing protein n=1 Tax=Mycobacterium heckeshornense TaxID=110505 RepID=A0A7R7GT32_9MYCO|nr:hypothetical protein MHEC_15330 [Mycobacterium heckeshornense]